MKFSIITICKNAHEYIRRTIESVLMQSYADYEYIIIDAASEDGTAEIAYSYADPRMTVISEPDNGISDAFNKGIRLSSGDALFFLNSGDYFVDHDVLALAAHDMESHEADIYTYSISDMVNQKLPENKKAGEESWKKALIPHQGTFVRKGVFLDVGGFNESFKIRMDYDFFYRCRKAGKVFYCNPVVITHYDLNGISSTDKYNFEKEGLAVRLLYGNKVDAGEREVIDFLAGADGAKRTEESEYLDRIRSQNDRMGKNHKIMAAMYRWLRLVNEGQNPCDFFLRRGYYHVAIYGFGMLGKILREELFRKQITVPYMIDQNPDIDEPGVLNWNAQWEPVDCIVVTPFYAYGAIRKRIQSEKGDFNVISLEDILLDAEENKCLV